MLAFSLVTSEERFFAKFVCRTLCGVCVCLEPHRVDINICSEPL